MKRSLCLFVSLVLLLTCLGCARDEAPLSQRTVDGLTITLPENFVDLSGKEPFADFSFVFSFDPVTVSGIKEDKAVFRAYGLELSLEDYATLLIKAHNVDAQLQQTDGIRYFTYEAGTGEAFTYVVTVWQTQDSFWTVQAYCPSADYDQVKDDMWRYLSSVTF